MKQFAKATLLTLPLLIGACGIQISAELASVVQARPVPERMDDFAFENDKVAFRLYGPALRESGENNGTDCWLKRVDYPIIDKWYKGHTQGTSYHVDHGEGYDPYHVGSSLGCGGIALWQGNNGSGDGLVQPNVYHSYKIIEKTAHKVVFELEYDYESLGIHEVKRISLEKGKRLYQAQSRFTKSGHPIQIQVAVGLATHDGKAEVQLNQAGNAITAWESMGESQLGTAVLLPLETEARFHLQQSTKKDRSHALLLTETNSNGELTYYAGYGWSKAGEIQTESDWIAYTDQFLIPQRVTHIQTFMHNTGWCWFQDPRAIIHNDRLVLGGVAGNGSGEAAIGVYDLNKKAIVGRTVVAEHFDHDDHNSPALYARPDGRILAVYARHTVENKHYYRLSQSKNYLNWGEEQVTLGKDPITYMNLLYLSQTDTLYNFYRGIAWNPTYKSSSDHGETWSHETHFIESEIPGHHRPYARYAGDGLATIGVSFTDAHPRQFGNSIYYAAFRDGKFYRADGTLIKPISDGPLKPSEAELVYQGSGLGFQAADLSVPQSAWTSSITFDQKGYPHIAYTLYLSNSDHRYRLAHWDGNGWQDREIAYAGTRLYDLESSYTGLISLDPSDPNHVVIATDVHPTSGEPLGGKHQIFIAQLTGDDNRDTIQWQQLSHDPSRHNIRPMIVTGEHHKAVVWLRGQYNSYTDYHMDAVGVIN